MTEQKIEVRNGPVWSCKVGVRGIFALPAGADAPMRRAVEAEFRRLTGTDAEFNFSGWGASLDEHELAVVENREPSEEHYRKWRLSETAPELLEALEKAAAWFRDYERQHRAKLTTESSLKADTNAERAEYLEAAIARATGAA